VERVVADLERLIDWEFNPPIELQEVDAKLLPRLRRVRLSRLDENIREAFERARSALLVMGKDLREATRRVRGRKATQVQPDQLSASFRRPTRRRELARMLRDQILALHPDQEKHPHAAKAEAACVARDIIGLHPRFQLAPASSSAKVGPHSRRQIQLVPVLNSRLGACVSWHGLTCYAGAYKINEEQEMTTNARGYHRCRARARVWRVLTVRALIRRGALPTVQVGRRGLPVAVLREEAE